MATSAFDLRKVIDVPQDTTDDDLSPFLDAAALLVSEDLNALGYSIARLAQIELALAAHFAIVGLESGGLQFSKAGDSSDQFKRIASDSVGFASTRWGQQALAFDSSGTLAAISANAKGKQSAKFEVVTGVPVI